MEERNKSEKVITEYRVIELEDGFRIEIKGDKEAIRNMPIPGLGGGFGPMGRRHGHGPHRMRKMMKRGMKKMMMMKMAQKMREGGPPEWWYGPDDGAPDAPKRGPEADRPNYV